MNNRELDKETKENSSVEIRLFDCKNDRILYKTLTNSELTGILASLKEINWRNLKGDK